MEFTSSPKPQLSSRANAFSIAALMSSGKPSSKDKEPEENTIKPLGKDPPGPERSGAEQKSPDLPSEAVLFSDAATKRKTRKHQESKETDH